ncbi:EPIDERMAL PATTERNING FACTOR-like protein 1 isoform X2 [Cucurbita pepo subsp. pepo]|nr:EPIDERMAL PATTERNING FACTOR-like protein 1 isoform X2 [Cucurbita pepo subsp. pepo]
MQCRSKTKAIPFPFTVAFLSTLHHHHFNSLNPFFPISTLQSFSHSLTQNMALNNSLFLILPLIFSLSVFHPTSGNEDSKQKELAIGSRPPKCFNKCLNCKPCVAALVISQRHKGDDSNNGGVVSNLEAAQVPKDDAYYLLSWKCKCKDKYFQPRKT